MRSDECNKQKQKTKRTQQHHTSQARDPTGALGNRRRVQVGYKLLVEDDH
jgi:hypothetical protein